MSFHSCFVHSFSQMCRDRAFWKYGKAGCRPMLKICLNASWIFCVWDQYLSKTMGCSKSSLRHTFWIEIHRILIIGGGNASRFGKHYQFLFGSCLGGFVGFHLSACSNAGTSCYNSHRTCRVVPRVQRFPCISWMTTATPLSCAEAIRDRAAIIRQPRKWWGFAEWIAWGWSRKTRVKMLLV